MPDRRLQVFQTVARMRSFTKAAEQLFMTQPAVTFQVKQLEEHFDARLFDRSHGRIALTPAGDVVLSYADRILALHEELEARVADLTGNVSGMLSIGASLTIAEFMLPRILGEFSVRYPLVQTRMTVANSEAIETRVAARELDIGLVESPSHRPELDSMVCCEDELVVVCAPGHELARRGRIAARELPGYPCVSRESGSGTREFTDHYLRGQGVPPEELRIVMEVGSPEAIKGVVETGLGFSILSKVTVAKELRLASLAAIPLEPRLIRILSLVSAREKFRSRLVATFAEFATAKMREIARDG